MLNKQFLGIFLLTVITCFSCERNEILVPDSQENEKQEQSDKRFRTTHLPAPDPCIPNIGGLQYFHITNFSVDNYTHNSGQEGYSMTNSSLDLGVGKTYRVSLDYHTHNTRDALGVNIWLDTNLDGIFTPDELIKSIGLGAGHTPTDIDFDITIPSIPNAALGINTTCRVMLYYKGNAVPNTKGDDPCNIESGEIQDYSINLHLDESGAFGPSSRSSYNAPIGLIYCTPDIGGLQSPYSSQILQYSSMERLTIKTFTDYHSANPGYSYSQTGMYFNQGETYQGSLRYWNHNSNDILGFRIWVDWNNNGSFESNEIVTSEVTTRGQYNYIMNFNVAIPNSATDGNYRMRTMLYYHGNHLPNTKGDDPCSIESGEIRDYRISVFNKISGAI